VDEFQLFKYTNTSNTVIRKRELDTVDTPVMSMMQFLRPHF